jgi:uncharacterized protein (DUF1015 family)
MPEIQPFRAHRYDLARVGALSDVVAPPYDVIDPALQTALYARHPHNVIRLILNKEEPGDDDRRNRYERAARFLKDWEHEGVLRPDAQPALYVYHQTFTVEGQSFTRSGVLARVRLEPLGTGRIYAHEETMPGPKADRLKLMHATGMNLSPVFGLYPDPEPRVQSVLDDAVRRSLPLEATDPLGTVSHLWPLTDGRINQQVCGLLHDKPVFIADGHHRYETALRYRDELSASTPLPHDAAAHFILMMLVGMEDPGLLILPTHRLISGLSALHSPRLVELLAPHFEVTIIGCGTVAAREAWGLIEANRSQSLLGFGTVADDTWHVAEFRAPEAMARLAPKHSPVWRGLAVSVVHVLVLDSVFQSQGWRPTCKYVHLLDEVLTSVGSRACQLAALVPPATMQNVADIASQLEKMPPKSTYFYPKLLSGLVFNTLR